MRRIPIAAFAAALVVTLSSFGDNTTQAQDPVVDQPTTQTQPPPAEQTAPACKTTQAQFARYARKVYLRDRITKKAIRKMDKMRSCAASSKAARNMLKYQRKQSRLRKQRIEMDSLTPYGEWAIPEYIVMCESRGSWTAYNPSGARGPYQFLGWKVPWPVRTAADRAAHHRMAARLWNGGRGASHWVCA